MPLIEIVAILLVIPVVFVLAGYPLVRRLDRLGPGDRVAAAMVAGVAALLLSVSVVNAILPLAGIWAWCCVAAWLVPFRRPDVRAALRADAARLAGSTGFWVALAIALAFLAALLWPLWSRPKVVFYDGSPNHDAFFWIANAEHLERGTYLVPPVVDAAHPFYYSTGAIVGLKPAWGRMGAEGLLALASGIARLSPFRIYLVAFAALYFPWVAAQLLVLRMFCAERRSRLVLWVVAALQPAFVYFHANANAPNLVGAVMGALVLVALAGATGPDGRRPWLVLLALGEHGLLVSYPEAAPAIALPAAFLLMRAWRTSGLRTARPPVAALGLGLLVNPLTTMRAWNGFFVSLSVAQRADLRPNAFGTVNGPAEFPAVGTLSVALGHALTQPVLAGLAGAALLIAVIVGIAWARDRWGTAALLSGVVVMFGFTMLTGFGYGWQKAVQFSGVVVASLVPGAALMGITPRPRTLRSAGMFGVVVIAAVVMAAALVANLAEAYKWSTRKYITRDWYQARDYSRSRLRNASVLIDAARFRWPYFYTMWSAYFLPENRLVFSGAGAGGYLRGDTDQHRPAWVAPPRLELVEQGEADAPPGRIRWQSGELAFVVLPGRR